MTRGGNIIDALLNRCTSSMHSVNLMYWESEELFFLKSCPIPDLYFIPATLCLIYGIKKRNQRATLKRYIFEALFTE